jgi:hypothetical protein
MITGADVLTMLIPKGGWVITGHDYKGIQFIECDPITEKQFKDGFATCQAWKDNQEAAKVSARKAILDRLGITAEEAALLLS